MTPINSGFTRLKVKVARIICKTNEKRLFQIIIMKLVITHRAFIFQMLTGLIGDMTSIDIELTKSKGKGQKGHFCKNIIVFTHYLENYLSQSFHILHTDWS